jgi:nicotinic acid mononucleotide adenylyltransferase
MTAGPMRRSRRATFNQLSDWLAMHDRLAALESAGPPTAQLLTGRPATGAPPPPIAGPPRRLAVLAGSFNPLTWAHSELARLALAAGTVDSVAYALSVRIVDKERITGAALEDRALALALHAAGSPGQWLLLLNRGLYVDQAAALRQSLPQLERLAFIVGYDKLLQIFDPRYYDDREAALERLFSLASLLVAPRDGQGRAAIEALLARSENRRFAAAVGWLPLAAAYTRLSSTRIRQEVVSGAPVEAVPVATRALLAATHVYAPPRRLSDGELIDDYALRLRLLAVLAATRPWAERSADLPRLLRRAWQAGRRGRALRAWLTAPPTDGAARAAALAAFQAAPAGGG